MTPHIEAKEGEIAKTVLMPGDPLRAKYIALKYLKDPKLVNEVRNCYAYTGYYKDKLITIMASGMGMPSIGIYSYELYNFYGVENIIRVGTAGSYTKDLDVYETILVESAYSKSTYAKYACKNDDDIINSDNELNQAILKTSEELSINLKSCRVHSSDVFYGDVDIDYLVNEKECLAVEMEAFALFNNAKKLNKRATAIITISDNLITHVETTSLERQEKFDDMIKLALEASLKL